jgi:hypothetical protein
MSKSFNLNRLFGKCYEEMGRLFFSIADYRGKEQRKSFPILVQLLLGSKPCQPHFTQLALGGLFATT